jgi:hypothetical protein
MSNQILGGKILKLVKERCQSHNNYFQGKLLTILMFQPPESETKESKLSKTNLENNLGKWWSQGN